MSFEPKTLMEMIETSNAYVRGMETMLDLCKKIYNKKSDGGWSNDEMDAIFGQHWNVDDIFKMGAVAIAEKVIAYQKKIDEIHVGDEVNGCYGKWIVYKTQEHTAFGFDSDGHFHSDKFTDLEKTGVHVQAVETMMKEWRQMP